MTFLFSEHVTGFEAADITITGGTKQENTFSGSGATYSLVVTPTDDIQSGTITVNVEGGVATTDFGDLPNIAAEQFIKPLIQKFPHSPSLQTPPAPLTGDVTFSFSFSEDVSGFTADDITVSGGTKQDRLLLRFGRYLIPLLLPQRIPSSQEPSPLMWMPMLLLMLPATATQPQHNSTKPLTQKDLSSTSPQTPQIPLTGVYLQLYLLRRCYRFRCR